MIISSDWPKKVLALGAHPDDIEIGCGGTLQKLIQTGNPELQIHWIVFSGTEQRAAEALASAENYLQHTQHQVRALSFQDSYFPSQWSEIKAELHETSQQFDPDLVFTHRLEDRHQDHRTLAELTWNTFRKQVILEYEIPKYEADLAHNNFYCKLTAELAEQKVDWLERFFTSQTEKPWFDRELFRGLMRLRGSESPGDAKYAEAFTCRKLEF